MKYPFLTQRELAQWINWRHKAFLEELREEREDQEPRWGIDCSGKLEYSFKDREGAYPRVCDISLSSVGRLLIEYGEEAKSYDGSPDAAIRQLTKLKRDVEKALKAAVESKND